MSGENRVGGESSTPSSEQTERRVDAEADIFAEIDEAMADPEYPHPKDGYRVEETFVESENTLYLAMHLRLGGKSKNTWTVGKWDAPGPAQYGDCKRAYWLYNAVSHYLNSGGAVDDLRNHVFDFCQGIMPILGNRIREKPLDISMPEGFELITSELVEDDDFQPTRGEYVFANEQSGEALIWIEDIDFKRTTLVALANEKAEMEEILDDVSAEVQLDECFQDEGENPY